MENNANTNSHDLAEAFGKIIRGVRKECGLSQEDLGFESGYHRTYVSLLERGLKSPSLQTVFAMARALGIRPSELLARVEAITYGKPK